MRGARDDTLEWVALHAAGVPGRCRAEVAREGPAAILARGTFDTGRRVLVFEPSAPRAEARKLQRFLADGGRVLGGPAPTSLGRWVRRTASPLCAYGRGLVP